MPVSTSLLTGTFVCAYGTKECEPVEHLGSNNPYNYQPELNLLPNRPMEDALLKSVIKIYKYNRGLLKEP